MIIAGRHYAPDAETEEQLIAVAVDKLGLSQLERFDPRKKIIEYQL